MFTAFKRIFHTAILGLRKQGLPAFAMVFVLFITCLQVSSVFLLSEVSQSLIAELEEKVDISVYFKENSSEEEIFSMKESLSLAPQVKDIEYISSEKAQETFIQRHKDDPLLMESLVQVGNPFLASLNIKAAALDQYEEIAGLLEEFSAEELIKKVDYYQRRPVIERIFIITAGIKKGLVLLSLVLAGIAVLVTFNTIRLGIYTFKNEIEIERLVGASNWFIRGPLLVQGAISGFFAAFLSLLVLGGACFALTSQLKVLWADLDLLSCFKANLSSIFLIQSLTGIGLGIFSSFIAIRRYLKI